jgi:hypothetical protein
MNGSPAVLFHLGCRGANRRGQGREVCFVLDMAVSLFGMSMTEYESRQYFLITVTR